MSKSIASPYVAYENKQSYGWSVAYRYLIADKIHFSVVASCSGEHGKWNAKRIAALLNHDHQPNPASHE